MIPHPSAVDDIVEQMNSNDPFNYSFGSRRGAITAEFMPYDLRLCV
jgi:hypothetical protein